MMSIGMLAAAQNLSDHRGARLVTRADRAGHISRAHSWLNTRWQT